MKEPKRQEVMLEDIKIASFVVHLQGQQGEALGFM